jgi:hypothetical protein
LASFDFHLKSRLILASFWRIREICAKLAADFEHAMRDRGACANHNSAGRRHSFEAVGIRAARFEWLGGDSFFL